MKHQIGHTLAWFYPLHILFLAAFIGPAQADTCDYPLTGASIDMDTEIVFLPTEEDTQKQARALESADAAKNGPEFNDGHIGMVAHITSLSEVKNLPTSFCMDVGNACESLLVWDSKLQAYSPVFMVDHIVDNGATSVYIDMLIPPNVVEKIRSEVTNKPFDFKIRGSVACPMSDDVGQTRTASPVVVGVELAKVPVVAIPKTRSTRGIDIHNSGMTMTEAYNKDFSNRKVGVGFRVEGKLDANAPEKTLTISNTGNFYTTIFNNNFTIFDVNLTSEKKPREKFQTSITLSSFYGEFYNKVLSKSQRNARSGRETRSADDEGRFSISLALSYVKEKGASTIVTLVAVPIKVEVGATAELGLAGSITPNINPSNMSFDINDIGPFVDVGAYASASLEAGIAEAGVRANLSLLNDKFVMLSKISLGSNFSATGTLKNILSGPTGSIELYAEAGWGFAKISGDITLVEWSSQLVKTHTLANWTHSAGDSTSGLIKNKKQNLCLDVEGHGGASGSNVILWTCNGDPDQIWTLQPNGEIKNKVQGMCLDVAGWAGNKGDNVGLYLCDDGLDQKWTLKANGELKNQKQGMCLDVAGWSGNRGDNVGLYLCDDGLDQRWYFQ